MIIKLILVLLFLIIITFLYLYFKKDNYLEFKLKNVVHEDFTVPKIIHQIWFQGNHTGLNCIPPFAVAFAPNILF